MDVLIVDDHQLFAEALRAALQEFGLNVVGVARRAHEGLEAAQQFRPDVVLIDLGLPDMDGVSLGREVLESLPECKILAITGIRDRQLLEETMRVGFHGFLTKDLRLRELVNAINAAADGQAVVPYQLSPNRRRGTPEDEALIRTARLTPREREVLGLLCGGASGEKIAVSLTVSPNTVRTHIQNILTKLQVRSRLEAVAFAVRFGFNGSRNGRY